MVSQQHGYISGQREAALSNSPAARLKADIGNLAQIGTSLEEYAVDHNGKHPHSLQELLKANRGAYMSQTPTVPGSGVPILFSYRRLTTEWAHMRLLMTGQSAQTHPSPQLTEVHAILRPAHTCS